MFASYTQAWKEIWLLIFFHHRLYLCLLFFLLEWHVIWSKDICLSFRLPVIHSPTDLSSSMDSKFSLPQGWSLWLCSGTGPFDYDVLLIFVIPLFSSPRQYIDPWSNIVCKALVSQGLRVIGHTLHLSASLVWSLDLSTLKCYGYLSGAHHDSVVTICFSWKSLLSLHSLNLGFHQFLSPLSNPWFSSDLQRSSSPPSCNYTYIHICTQHVHTWDQAAHFSVLLSSPLDVLHYLHSMLGKAGCAELHLASTALLTYHISSVLGLCQIIFHFSLTRLKFHLKRKPEEAPYFPC